MTRRQESFFLLCTLLLILIFSIVVFLYISRKNWYKFFDSKSEILAEKASGGESEMRNNAGTVEEENRIVKTSLLDEKPVRVLEEEQTVPEKMLEDSSRRWTEKKCPETRSMESSVEISKTQAWDTPDPAKVRGRVQEENNAVESDAKSEELQNTTLSVPSDQSKNDRNGVLAIIAVGKDEVNKAVALPTNTRGVEEEDLVGLDVKRENLALRHKGGVDDKKSTEVQAYELSDMSERLTSSQLGEQEDMVDDVQSDIGVEDLQIKANEKKPPAQTNSHVLYTLNNGAQNEPLQNSQQNGQQRVENAAIPLQNSEQDEEQKADNEKLKLTNSKQEVEQKAYDEMVKLTNSEQDEKEKVNNAAPLRDSKQDEEQKAYDEMVKLTNSEQDEKEKVNNNETQAGNYNETESLTANNKVEPLHNVEQDKLKVMNSEATSLNNVKLNDSSLVNDGKTSLDDEEQLILLGKEVVDEIFAKLCAERVIKMSNMEQ